MLFHTPHECNFYLPELEGFFTLQLRNSDRIVVAMKLISNSCIDNTALLRTKVGKSVLLRFFDTHHFTDHIISTWESVNRCKSDEITLWFWLDYESIIIALKGGKRCLMTWGWVNYQQMYFFLKWT